MVITSATICSFRTGSLSTTSATHTNGSTITTKLYLPIDRILATFLPRCNTGERYAKMFKKIAILGATGAVGRELIRLLERDHFPVDMLVLLASKRSAGQIIRFRDESLTVRDVHGYDWRDTDLVFMSAGASVSREYAPLARASGSLIIDNSSAFRMDDDVPLVVPEINPQDAFLHAGIIANPNCTTAIALLALFPIAREFGIRRVIASTYQAVSGAGESGVRELRQQSLLDDHEIPDADHSVFPHPVSRNVIPCIGSITDNGYTTEEMKFRDEGRKILHAPELRASMTCVRVPVVRAHTVSLTIECVRRVRVDEVREVMCHADGVVIADSPQDGVYPTPLWAQHKSAVLVGRIREDMAFDNGISLVVSGDQLLKGAALNAMQIAVLFL